MNRRGATSFALLLGVGAGLSFGIAVDVVLLLLQGGQVPDLIGSLGLPGAILALVGAFFLGAKAYMTLKPKNGNTGDSALNAERRTGTAVEKVITRIDLLREELREGQKEIRHDQRNALAAVQSEILLAVREVRSAVDERRP